MLSLSFTPHLGPGVYWFCTWCLYRGIALAYDIPPPIVLFWIIHLLIKYCNFCPFPSFHIAHVSVLCLTITPASTSFITEDLSSNLYWLPHSPPSALLESTLLTDTMLLRLFTAHTLLYVNTVLGQQAFFWVFEPWRWDQ